MSCDQNRTAFVAHVAANPAIAAALGNGDPQLAASVLESVYQTAKSEAERTRQRQRQSSDMSPQARAALLAARIGCTVLFGRIVAAQIKPPVHTKPRPGQSVTLPRSAASQAGYAAMEQTLRAIEQGTPLPALTCDILAARSVQPEVLATVRTIQSQMDRLFDSHPALRFHAEATYGSQELMSNLTSAKVHKELISAAQALRGPAVPSRLRTAAEEYLVKTRAGPSTDATRAFVRMLSAAKDTEPETEQSRATIQRLIADRIGQTVCLNLANGIHQDDARSAIAGLRGTANAVLSTMDAPIDWRLAAAQWQHQRPFNDWSPTGAHDVAFACYLAKTSGIATCPQCQQFMSSNRPHACPVVSPPA